MVQDTYQNGVGSALFVSGVLSNSALVYICVVFSGYPRPGRPRSAKVCPGQSQIAGSPRFSQEINDFLRFCGFPGFPGRTWVLFSAFLWISEISWENLGVIFCVFVGFRDFLGEPGCYFLCFCGFPRFPGRTCFCGVSGISWENLGGNSWGWAWESCKS